MGPLLKIFILFSFFSFTSCHYLMPSCTDGFELYKRPIVVTPKYQFKINGGAYLAKNGSFKIFFQNGSTKGGGYVSKDSELDFTAFSSKENWQEYSIIGDTIIFQGFNHHTTELCRRWVFETKGLITSDTSYSIVSTYNYRDKSKEIYNPPITITFFPTPIRPDSTVAWYQNKSWYKKHVHPSRK